MPSRKPRKRRRAGGAPAKRAVHTQRIDTIVQPRVLRQPASSTSSFALSRLRAATPLVSRIFGAESPLWVVLVLVVPILIICLKLTTGLRHNQWPLVDADFWWHLATGNWVLDRHRIPLTDSYSWTHDGQSWIAHEWLAEVVLALSWRAGGYAGGVILTAIVCVLGFWRLIEGARYYGLSRRAAAITMLAFGGVFVRAGVITVRPQVWTWTLLAILMAELAAYDTGRRKQLWVVPAIIVIMINMNLTALIAVGCVGAFTIDRLIRRPIDRHVVTIAVLSGLAMLVNPNHIELPLLTIKYIGEDAIWRQYIFEWMPPKFGERTHHPFWIALVLLIPAIWYLARRKPNFWPAAPLIVLAYQSYKSLRYIPVFILIAFMFAGWLAGQWGRIRQEQETRHQVPDSLIPRRAWVLTPIIAATALSIVLATSTDQTQFRREPLLWTHPAEATTFYLKNYPETRIFNTYDFGGYLIYRFADTNNKVFVDGRAEMYGDSFIRRYFDLIYARDGWQAYFDEQGIQAVIIRHIDGLSVAIAEEPGWTLVYRDRLHLVYVRTSIAHQPFA